MVSRVLKQVLKTSIDPLHLIRCVTRKHVLKYLKGTVHFGIRYIGDEGLLHVFCDSDWIADVDSQKEYFQVVFQL